jgi:hypothetical protein
MHCPHGQHPKTKKLKAEGRHNFTKSLPKGGNGRNLPQGEG